MGKKPLVELLVCGQSFWLDNIRREWLQDGTLAKMVREDGLRGLTSNPAIFYNSITSSSLYREQIQTLAAAGASTQTIYEALVIGDIQMAADVLAVVHESSGGVDGYVSLEVSPLLAHDAAGTVEEARRLYAAVGRRNVMIKVPGTPAGLEAIETLTAEGIPINVTLLFSTTHYELTAQAYIRGLRRRMNRGLPVKGVASVASVFLSRIDTLVDQLLSHRILPGKAHPAGVSPATLMGKIAIASTKRTYAVFESLFGPTFDDLRAAGASPQRPLWASTSTKNPLYNDVMYVEPLVGSQTVNTMPDATVKAYSAKGQPKPDVIKQDLPAAYSTLDALESLGINLDQVCQFLQDDAVEKFIVPFRKLLSAIEGQRLTARPDLLTTTQIAYHPAAALTALLPALDEARYPERLWAADPQLWRQDEAGVASIKNRLGWLRLPSEMPAKLAEINGFAAEIQAEGVRHVVLLGMGGSSLSPEVATLICPPSNSAQQKPWPKLHILDTTHPDAIEATFDAIDLSKSLFIVASKSGSTIETSCLFNLSRTRLQEALGSGWVRHMVAITDPNTQLSQQAAALGLRRTFLNPPDIGGRYSALSYFGLVPMALCGVDVSGLLSRACAFAEAASAQSPSDRNPALQLGAVLALAHAQGRNKLTLYTPKAFEPFGDWLEQLVAESTGKQGLGILPIIREDAAALPVETAKDRLLVRYMLPSSGQPPAAPPNTPCVHIHLQSPLDLGQEFLRWELATAFAAAIIGINPFDEPDVRLAKDRTEAQLAHFAAHGRFDEPAGLPTAPAQTLQSDQTSRAGLTSASAASHRAPDYIKKALSLYGSDYIALISYLPMSRENVEAMNQLRATVQELHPGRPITVGFGPRFLHSIGQLYKGGFGGLFITLTNSPKRTTSIPEYTYTFNTLITAQALGDFRALEARDRRVLRLDLGVQDPADAIRELCKSLKELV